MKLAICQDMPLKQIVLGANKPPGFKLVSRSLRSGGSCACVPCVAVVCFGWCLSTSSLAGLGVLPLHMFVSDFGSGPPLTDLQLAASGADVDALEQVCCSCAGSAFRAQAFALCCRKVTAVCHLK